ncbi:unnamed protein product, partial [Rotaria sp. Silwood2]
MSCCRNENKNENLFLNKRKLFFRSLM